MKNSIKTLLAVGIIMTGVLTAYAVMPSSEERHREDLAIMKGNIQGQQIQLHLANLKIQANIDLELAQKADNSNQYVTLDSQLQALDAEFLGTFQ